MTVFIKFITVRLLKTSLYIAFFVLCLLAVTIGPIWWAFNGPGATSKLRAAYGREAVKVLAVDAARAFPLEIYGAVPSLRFWPRNETTPCIFTTMKYELHPPNGRSFTPGGWPSGTIPSCPDFFSSMKQDYDLKTTIPQNCIPAITYTNTGGDKGTYVVAAADGTNLQPLRDAQLSNEARTELQESELHFPSSPYISNFIRGGGLDDVQVQFIGEETCDGFTLFRYQTVVDNPRGIQPRLSQAGYNVGLK